MTADLSERAFVGALMHLTAERVVALAGLVAADDLSDPRLAVLYGGIVEVAASGAAPDPARVDAHLRESGAIRPADRATVVGLIVDLHAEVPIPTTAEAYGRSVVQESIRRRVLEGVTRLAHAAEVSRLDGLVEVVAAEAVAMVVACKRLEAPVIGGAA